MLFILNCCKDTNLRIKCSFYCLTLLIQAGTFDLNGCVELMLTKVIFITFFEIFNIDYE